jgi:adenosylcobinamide hydrolase
MLRSSPRCASSSHEDRGSRRGSGGRAQLAPALSFQCGTGRGLGEIKTWLNLQVDLGYSCRDPQGDLRRAAVDMQEPVVGMLTAAKVDRYTTSTQGSATAIATLGLRHPIAAAAPAHVDIDMPAGTINLLAVVDVALTDAGL